MFAQLDRFGATFHIGGPLFPGRLGSYHIVDGDQEYVASLGYARLSSGRGTSRTLSAAGGGKFGWGVSSVYTLGVSSVLRIGFQGRSYINKDDTWGAYADINGPLVANTLYSTAATSGSTTVADGDLICVVAQITTFTTGDNLRLYTNSSNTPGIPWGMLNNVADDPMALVLIFDDDTVGLLGGFSGQDELLQIPVYSYVANVSSSSSPNEYASAFQVPCRLQTTMLYGNFGEVDSSDTGTLTLYADPFGSPVTLAQVDALLSPLTVTATGYHLYPIAPVTLEPNTWYAVGYAATNALSRYVRRVAVHEDFVPAWRHPIKGATRTTSGAFTPVTTDIGAHGIIVSALDLNMRQPRTRPLKGF